MTELGGRGSDPLVQTATDLAHDPIGVVMSRPLDDDAVGRLLALQPADHAVEVVYLSTPITTGPRLLAWLANHAAPEVGEDANSAAELVREEIIAENLSRLGPVREAVRARNGECHLIDPTALTVPEWSQRQYHRFWCEVLLTFVDRVVFADGWHLSTGCVIEYATGLAVGLPMEDAAGRPLTPAMARPLLREGARLLAAAGRDPSVNDAVAERAEEVARRPFKDTQLADLAESYNVASFVTLTPQHPFLRYQVLPGPRLSRSAGVESAIDLLLQTSRSRSVNVRTFRPDADKGNPFHYGLRDAESVMRLVREYSREGYFCIVNETIDIHDGGVSGVTLGGIAEFAPDDTPRAVEADDAARLPIGMAERLLRIAYGENVKLPFGSARRIEFSVHPARVGHRSEQVIVWEAETVDAVELEVDIQWPNRFSRLLGDKTFGLLVGEAVGASVPATTVVSRRVAPFRFGRTTGTAEWWMRTAPAEQTPGHFTTTRGWSDPFAVLAKEDSDTSVAAVLAQEGVAADYSGASLPVADGSGHLIEGVRGFGSDFMLGGASTSALPSHIERRVQNLLTELEQTLGRGVRIEWACDAETVWVLQLHRTVEGGKSGVFNPGSAERWLSFDPSLGLDALSDLIAEAREQGAGVEVTRPVGLTSHIGDLLRKSGVPGRLAVRASAAPRPDR